MKIEASIFNSKFDNLARIFFLVSLIFLPVSSFLNNAIILAVIFSLLGGNIAEKLSYFWKFKMNIFALMLVAILAIGMFYHPLGWQAGFHQFFKYSHKFIFILFLLPLFIDEKWRRYTLDTLIYTALVFSIIYCLHAYHIVNFHTEAIFHRDFWYILSRIPWSFYVAIAAFILLNRVLDEEKNKKINMAYCVFLLFFIFFVNAERTGMLVTLALLSLFIVQRKGLKGVLIMVLLVPLLSISLYFASPIVKSRINLAMDNIHNYQQGKVNTSIGLRMAFARNSLQLVEKKLWFGYGTGSFTHMYEKTGGPRLEVDGPPLGDPHNSYINLLVQVGMIGLFTFMSWLLMQLIETFSLPKNERRLMQGLILAFVIACFCVSAFLKSRIFMLYICSSLVLYASRFSLSYKEQPHELEEEVAVINQLKFQQG